MLKINSANCDEGFGNQVFSFLFNLRVHSDKGFLDRNISFLRILGVNSDEVLQTQRSVFSGCSNSITDSGFTVSTLIKVL